MPKQAGRQIVQQHVELGSEQFAVALLEMPLQLRLVWQNPVQAAVQTRVVELAGPKGSISSQRLVCPKLAPPFRF